MHTALLLLKPSAWFYDSLWGFLFPLGSLQSVWNIPDLGKQVACGSNIWHVTTTQKHQSFPTTTSLITSHQPTSHCNVSVATLRFPKRHSERSSTPSLGALFSPCYRNRGSGEFWGHCPDLWDLSLNLIVNCCSTYRVKPKLNKGSRNTWKTFVFWEHALHQCSQRGG